MPLTTVKVPPEMAPLFEEAEQIVSAYFAVRRDDPSKGTIEIGGERYVIMRAAALSVEFFALVEKLFGPGHERRAHDFARNLLFDLAHALGRADAKNFHAKMGLTDPIARLSAGPIHFAHSGWASVDISPESRPSQDEEYFLLYDHPYAFEADAWIRSGRKADFPVCVMNAGYSSGWCEESFGLPLVACEILCTARGDDRCRFVMAPPERIEARIQAYSRSEPGIAARAGNYEIPDLFARRRAEEALRASEAKYRALVEMTETGFLILDGEGRVVDANDEYVRLSGHRAQAEILGRSVLEWTDGASREKNAAAIAQALRDRSVRGLEIDYVDGQGRTTPVEIDATVEGEGDGLRIISLCRDITDRRRAEAALRESEERFRQVAQIVEEFVWEVDAAGRYTYANPVVEKVLGYRPEELVGKKHFSDLFPPAEREALRRKALEVFARRESFRRFVNENLHRDGHRVMLETSAVPLLDAAGNLLGYRGADRDVTEHEQLERSRRERLAELEEFQSVMLGRESRIVEMKEEVNDLLRQLGRPRKYDI